MIMQFDEDTLMVGKDIPCCLEESQPFMHWIKFYLWENMREKAIWSFRQKPLQGPGLFRGPKILPLRHFTQGYTMFNLVFCIKRR